MLGKSFSYLKIFLSRVAMAKWIEKICNKSITTKSIYNQNQLQFSVIVIKYYVDR